MAKSFPHKGSLWRLYGFTKTHFWGVAIVSHIFVIGGMVLAGYSVLASEELALRILLLAICSLLVGCATLLLSILTLLFFLGSSYISDDENAA
jgi:hypothetical protein